MTGATPVATPMEANTHLMSEDCLPPGKIDKQFRCEYQRIVGFMLNQGQSHMNAARRILRYLAGSAGLGITYEAQLKSRENLLWGFADAYHAGNPDTRHSVTGCVTMLCSGAISASNSQAVVALSSSEAEFYAASAAGCDIASDTVLHHKSKHINVRVYHLCNLCKAGTMSLLKIRTDDQVADALTKALPRPEFVSHCGVMMNIKP
eukprot:1424270-Rhodomonas_salina.4